MRRRRFPPGLLGPCLVFGTVYPVPQRRGGRESGPTADIFISRSSETRIDGSWVTRVTKVMIITITLRDLPLTKQFWRVGSAVPTSWVSPMGPKV